MPPKAYSYLRFSTPEQGLGDSRRRQTALAEEFARQHGLTLDTELTFRDLGVSAFRGKNARTGALRAFLDAVEDGLIDQGSYLLVESLDRISRDQILAAQGLFLQIIQAGVVLVTLADRRIYSTASINANPTDLIISLVAMMRANEESATKSRRLVAAWGAKRDRAATHPLTSVCPAWLRLDPATRRFEIIPERGVVVQRIYTETLGGKGQHAIASGLNHEGVPVFGHRGRVGRRWHRSYLAKILGNDAVVGTFIPHRMEHMDGRRRRVALAPVPNYYPAVVAPETFERVRALHATRQPLRGRHASGVVANILGGLARCPLCAGSMTLATKGPRWRYLVCASAKSGAGCRYRAVRYQGVEQAIVEGGYAITRACPSGSPEEERLTGIIDNADDQIEVLRDALENLLENAAHHASSALAARIATIEAEIEKQRALQRELAARHALLAPTRRQARLDEIERTAASRPLDRAALNTALRVLLSGVVVNYLSGHLVFQWTHGDETQLFWAWPEDEAGAARETAAA